jgi:hypothetical protein
MSRAKLTWIACAAVMLVAGPCALAQGWEQGKPGEHHARLAGLAGQWKIKVAMGGQTGEGKTEFHSVMEGRYLIEETRCSVGDFEMAWMGFHGYDNEKKKHVSSWIDNLETGIEPMEGTCDESGTTIVYATDNVDHELGGTKRVEWILRILENDRFAVEMRTTRAKGEPTVDLTIEGTRRP